MFDYLSKHRCRAAVKRHTIRSRNGHEAPGSTVAAAAATPPRQLLGSGVTDAGSLHRAALRQRAQQPNLKRIATETKAYAKLAAKTAMRPGKPRSVAATTQEDVRAFNCNRSWSRSLRTRSNFRPDASSCRT